jgi:hypothetical protein
MAATAPSSARTASSFERVIISSVQFRSHSRRFVEGEQVSRGIVDDQIGDRPSQ